MDTTIISGSEEVAQRLYETEAKKVIKKYTLIATAAGVVPIPVISTAGVIAAQVFMVRELTQQFNIPFDEDRASVIINSAIGGVLSKVFAMTVDAVVPGSGVAGIDLSSGAISGIYTATVGEFYKVHFQKGGTLENASIGDLGNYFMEEIQRGDIGLNSITNPTQFMKSLVV